MSYLVVEKCLVKEEKTKIGTSFKRLLNKLRFKQHYLRFIRNSKGGKREINDLDTSHPGSVCSYILFYCMETGKRLCSQ